MAQLTHANFRSRLIPELVGAMSSAMLALLGVTAALRLWHAHPNIPLSGAGDSMLTLMIVRSMQTTGWYQSTPSLGAPFGQDFTAYPATVGDLWHTVALKLLSLGLSPAATVNAFFVLGFAAIAAFAYVCLRALGVSRPLASALGAVYSWLPYHFLRSENHLFLSGYYAIPVACVLAVWLYQGRLDLTRSLRRPPAKAWWAFASAVLLAGTGLYYGVFAIVLIIAAAVFAALAVRSWRPLASGAALTAVIGAGLVLAAIPNLLHTSPLGSETTVVGRAYGATEFYGLKITNLLLPWALHRIPALARLRSSTVDSPIPGEGSETLGVLGVIGLIVVLVMVLLPVLRVDTRLTRQMQPLGALTIVALLSATVAGLNSVIAALGFAEMRAWNRMSVVVAFLALAGLAHVLDLVIVRIRTTAMRRGATLRRLVAPLIALAVLGVGLYDQTSDQLVPDYAGTAAGWNSDEAYFHSLEGTLGAGAAVFTLPYAPFPENPPIVNMGDYNHLRGYIHSDLRWSYGGAKGEQSEWQPVALADGTAIAIPRLVAAGFDAVYVNRVGYADHGAQVESEIVATIGAEVPMINADGNLATYDLRGYAARLAASGAQLPSRDSVIFPLRLVAGLGVYGEERSETERWYWGQAVASFALVNPAPNDTKFVITGIVQVADPSATVTVRVGSDVTHLRVVNGSAVLDIPFSAGTGATDITFTTDSARTPSDPGDTRDLRQRLVNLTVSPVS